MGNTKKYWKSFAQLNNDPKFVESSKNEFQEELPIDAFLGDNNLSETTTHRRDFLKFLGFSVTAASLAACETPVIKAIPYVNKPEDLTPGVANYYASTFFDGNDYAPVLVKTREGRPIHISGNKNSRITNGGINARANSSVLSLYDTERLKGPMDGSNEANWDQVDSKIMKELSEIANAGGNIRILSGTIISPSTKQAIADFAARYPNTLHVAYDPVSYSGMLKANEESFGKAVIPSYDFSKSRVVVSVGADFLSNWGSSIEHLGNFAKTRRPENKWMSRLFVFESIMSLTGSNADVRVPVKPSEQGLAVIALYNYIARKKGGQTVTSVTVPFQAAIEKAGDELLANAGNSIVVAGSNDVHTQTMVNAINALLENYGNTIDLNNYDTTKQGRDEQVMKLVDDMEKGTVSALFIYGVNPAYSLPNGNAFASALNKVRLSVSFSDRIDETASLVKFICPDHHYLESWNDFQPRRNKFSLSQPTISPLFKTRQAQESLLRWSGNNTSYYAYIRNNWQKNQFGQQNTHADFDTFWNNALHDGVYETAGQAGEGLSFAGNITTAAQKLTSVNAGNLELVLYTKTAIGDGNQANNPWLQEMPDPITRISWDNYITMNPNQMSDASHGFNLMERGEDHADMAEVTVNGTRIELPVVPMPGQAMGTIGIALGYGRTMAGKAGNNIGGNAYPFVAYANGHLQYHVFNAGINKLAGKTYPIAASQQHHTLMGREEGIVRETVLSEYLKDPKSGNPENILATHKGPKNVKKIDLWRDHPVEVAGHRWAMTIDLNTCFGCGSCVTACHSENNVPVVGKDEVRRGRDMHWLRIDRYFSSAMTKEKAETENKGTIDMYNAMEVPEAVNPEVVFQPMLCQHCNHAPCETVCPVAATTHSNEGLNQMAYNRCIGTRYCANNCPYKVRRFNWFNYPTNQMFSEVNPASDELTRMVLNPDVIVRERGVMEKCTFCVQRIQLGKLDAKKEKRKVKDGEIVTACASACPTKAINFGDYNDVMANDGQGSMVKQIGDSPRAYHVIEEVGTKPNIFYLTKVRNKSAEDHKTV